MPNMINRELAYAIKLCGRYRISRTGIARMIHIRIVFTGETKARRKAFLI